MLVARRCHPLPLLVVSFLDVSGVFWCASCACKGFFSGKGTQEWVPKRPQFPLAYTTAHLWRQCLGSQRYLFIETGWDMRHCAKWMSTEIWSSKVFQTFQTAFKNSSDFHPWNAKCAKSHNSKTGSIDAWGIQVLAPAGTYTLPQFQNRDGVTAGSFGGFRTSVASVAYKWGTSCRTMSAVS